MIETERLVKNPHVQIIAILIRFQRSASEAALEEDEANATIVKSEPVIKTEEEGNFKRPKKEEEDEEEFDDDIDGPGIDGPDLLADDEVEAEDAVATTQ